jgi:hypothetical protein
MRIFICLLSCLFGCFTLPAQFTYEHVWVDQASALTYENLRLIPIRAKASFSNAATNPALAPSLEYITLREAMFQGDLTIRDRAGVNVLLIDNLSKQPVLLLSGEILKGGKQDRIIGRDMLLPASSRRNRVPVYCVEQDRWSSAKEWTYYHEGSQHLRRVVDQSRNQRQVWREVEDELRSDGVTSRTRAYTAHSSSPQYAAQESAYLRAFPPAPFPEPETVIGILGITGSVVIGCDLFASPQLFQREYDGLIFAYIDEAITFGLPVSITPEALQRYLDNLLSNERMQQAFVQQYGKVFTDDNGHIIHLTTFDER